MTVNLDNIDFAQLIGDRDIDICKLIEVINKQGIALALYNYARHIIKDRWPEAEPYIMEDPEWAYCYVRYVIRGRWIEAEPYIKKDPGRAYFYARDVIEGRWPEAEPHIKKDPEWARVYSGYFGVEL